ncbi:hypothetical protein LDENG_00055350 [Lucifuga dentata]|nr:hypothetical protein LDENG_00055350 [Lucifuga dentata]
MYLPRGTSTIHSSTTLFTLVRGLKELQASSEGPKDQEWLEHLNHMLQQKIPSASQLMEAVRVKMKERKVLTEELATLTTPVSENA